MFHLLPEDVLGIYWWGGRKEREELIGVTVSFVTLSLCCSELVIALAACSASADLQLVTGVCEAFQLFKTKYCCAGAVAQLESRAAMRKE